MIENYVIDRYVGDRAPRERLTIGWVAADEHRLDLERIPVEEAMAALLDAHPDVRVTTIGVKLDLVHDRYRHRPPVAISQLLHHVSAFHLGIAPLSPDLAINRARSNIKLKEYAAVGVPWVASPIGPYAGLGAKQGGMLVADHGWQDALDGLVRRPRWRAKLAKRARRWGAREGLTRNAQRWERELEQALSAASG